MSKTTKPRRRQALVVTPCFPAGDVIGILSDGQALIVADQRGHLWEVSFGGMKLVKVIRG
jgi:hypothetical protein